jgi:hypothetical protein
MLLQIGSTHPSVVVVLTTGFDEVLKSNGK